MRDKKTPPNKQQFKLTLNSSLVQEVAQLEVAVAGGKVLREPLEQMTVHLEEKVVFTRLIAHLIPIAHEVVDGDESFIDHHPTGVEGSLYQQVGQGGNGDIGFISTVQQI